MDDALIVECNKEIIFQITMTGDIILRGKIIGNDLQVAKMFASQGVTIKP